MWHNFFLRLHCQRSALHYALIPLSMAYRAVVGFRNSLYRTGLMKSRRLPGRVISVGNITVGGTGKTPAVLMIAGWAMAEGRKVCVLSRGYGGRRKGSEPLFVSNTERVLADAEQAGDEAFLLARRLPGVPVVVCADRFKAGVKAAEHWGCDIFVLDDGFQHLALARDADIVLLDWKEPFGNGMLLPLGPLREPVQSVTRAHVIILTRAESLTVEIPDALTALRGRIPPCFTAEHTPRSIVIPARGIEQPLEYCSGKLVLGFAGIGNPDSFKKTLDSLGARTVAFESFPDHHPYSEADMRRLASLARKTGADLVLTTEKDWVRLDRWDDPIELGYIAIEFKVHGENRFWALLRRHVGGSNH